MHQDIITQTQVQFQESVMGRFEALPVSVGELTVWYKHGLPPSLRVPVTAPIIRPATVAEVAPLVAAAVQRPLARGSVKIHRQAGRLVEVAYRPLRAQDPTMVVALMPGAAKFHRAMLIFCNTIRQHVYHWEGRSWYQDAVLAGRRVLQPLAMLQPTVEEAGLVVRFLLDRITYGEPR